MTQCIKSIILFLSGVFLIAGCSVVDTVVDKFKTVKDVEEKVVEEKVAEKKEWTPVEQIDQIIWADDASEVAVVMLYFEARGGEENTEKRYFKHQIFTQKSDSEERFPLTELRDHRVGQVFFMKSENYLIIESILQDDARRFDRVDMKGHEILIIETPDERHQPCQSRRDSSTQVKSTTETEPDTSVPFVNHTVIPSPDGKQLAHVYSPECDKASVEFLDADSLMVLDNQTFNIDEPMEVTWHPEGYIIFSTPKRDKAWKVKAKESPLPILPPKCLSPVTTSSPVSAEGRLVFLDDNGKLMTRDIGRKKAFGCQ